jgi:DNA-binding transcriptional ArsR family regulator
MLMHLDCFIEFYLKISNTQAMKPPIVEQAEKIELLASPARIEIMDTLEALGCMVTVAELAAAMGRPADGLYYHLRQLADGGLIEEELLPAGRCYRTLTRPGKRLSLRYTPGKNANARAVRKVAASIARVSERDFARALASEDTVAEGPARELWAARGKGWVNETDLAEINQLLARVMSVLHRGRTPDKDRLIAVSWMLAPVDAKPARRRPKR